MYESGSQRQRLMKQKWQTLNFMHAFTQELFLVRCDSFFHIFYLILKGMRVGRGTWMYNPIKVPITLPLKDFKVDLLRF